MGSVWDEISDVWEHADKYKRIVKLGMSLARFPDSDREFREGVDAIVAESHKPMTKPQKESTNG